MPQIVEVQTYLWGSLPAHPVPLPPDRVTALVGANGSGKTTLLDAVKLLFGLTRFTGAGGRDDEPRTATGYLHRPPGPEPNSPRGEAVPWAIVKGVFLNPPRPGGSRPFGDAGGGTAQAEHVTVVAHVRAEGVRWTALAGWRTWGVHGDREAELRRIRELPRSRWYGQEAYQQLLVRAGASRALFEVLSLGQGEASAALSGDEQEALRKVLQILGQQEPLEKFARARRRYGEVQQSLDRAEGDLRTVRAEAARTAELVRTFKQWILLGEQIEHLERMELPAALRRERETQREARDAARRRISELDAREPELRERLREGDLRERALRARRGDLLDALNDARDAHRAAEAISAAAEAAIAAYPDATTADVASARVLADETAAAAAGETAREAELSEDARELAAGRHTRPPMLRRALELLDEDEIEHRVLAESVGADVDEALALEARLGDAVWAVGVTAAAFDRAWERVSGEGLRVPVVRLASDWEPFVEELGDPLRPLDGAPPGVLRGTTFAWLRAAEPPRLGAEGRERRAAAIAEELARVRERRLEAEEQARAAAARAEAAAASVEAQGCLSALRSDVVDAEAAHKLARDAEAELVDELMDLTKTLTRDRDELDTIGPSREHQKVLERRAAGTLRRIDAELERLAERERPADPSLPERSSETIVAELRTSKAQHGNLNAFPAEAREPAIEERLARQRQQEQEIADLVEGRAEELRLVHEQVEDNRAVFVETVQRSVRRLDARFGALCEEAAMTGRVRLLGDERDGFRLRIEVTATGGQGSARLGSSDLSGGQRAKAALVLLLACMSLEGAADILVSDEPGAHLDAGNLRDVGEAMERIVGDVQVIVSAPTDAEAERLDWSAHQITFWPPERDDADWPFVRLGITSRLPEQDAGEPEGGFT